MNKNLKLWLVRGLWAGAAFIGFLIAQVATSTLYSQLPSASPGGTFNYLTNNCLFAINTNSTGTRTWFPAANCASVTPPNASSNWTLVTDGSATKSDQGNTVVLNEATANNHVEALLKAVPGGAYTKTFTIRMAGFASTAASGNINCGVLWTDGTATTNKWQWLRLDAAGAGPVLQVAHAANFSFGTFVADKTAAATIGIDGGTITMKIQDDTANRIVFVGNGGQNLSQFYSTVRTTPFTPTNYGVACSGSASTDAFNLQILGED